MSNNENLNSEDFLLIIDGSSLLTTQFFGNLPKEIMFAKTTEEKEQYFHKIMQTSKGEYTNAVYGFMRTLLKIIKEQKPKYLAVTWDVSRNTFRREMYADYKGNRGETLAPLKEQFIRCQELLKALNIPQFMDERYEADDFSGSLSHKFEKEVPVRIMTKDNDYLQLVTERTNLWIIHSTAKKTDELYAKFGMKKKDWNVPDRTFPFDLERLEEEFGIKPSSVPSLKGLQGDTSDNIKGVPGIGETTALALVKEYKTIDALYDAIRDLDDAGKKKMVEYWKSIGIKRSPMNYLLKESEEELVGEKAAFLSRDLATIKCDIDLSDVTLESLEVHVDKEKAEKEFERLEFKSLKFEDGTESEKEEGFVAAEDAGDNPFEESAPKKKAKKKENDELDYAVDLDEEAKRKEEELEKIKAPETLMDASELVIVTEKEKADAIFNDILQKKEYIALSFIAEKILKKNAPADRNNQNLIGLSITVSKERTFFLRADGEITKEYLMQKVKELISNKIKIVVFNLKAQLPFLQAERGDAVFDVEVAAYLIDPTKGSYRYDEVAAEYMKLELESKADLLGKGTYEDLCAETENRLLLEEMEESVSTAKLRFKKAVGYESMTGYAVYGRLEEGLKICGMESLFLDIEMPLIYTLYDMETRGIRVNKEELKEYGDALAASIETLEKDIYELVGESFNINSPKQLGVILFEKMGLPFGKKTKTGYSTSADVLEKLKSEHEVVAKILEYRQLTKLKSTYADGLANYIEADGRIHGTFNQTITATGRISSTEPNLQNIPIRMELGRKIRKVFIPEDGYVFLDADYSQIELRVLADMSGDEKLIEAYKSGQDIHRLTASQVFHTPFDEVTSLQRSNAKAVNFGIVYGISSFSLGQDLNISRNEAEEYITKYFETYPNVKHFLDGIVEQGRREGVVTTQFGRIRPVPDLHNSNFMKRSAEERIAMNSPIQGTAADIIKIAMIRVNEALKERNMKSRLLLQIHDELLVEAYEPEVEEVKKIMREQMQNAADMKVPLVADVNAGSNWYDAK